MNESWVFILSNHRGTVLYVGVTTNLQQRLEQHANGLGSAFTKKYRVTRLLYFETFHDVRFAIAREKEIKGWRRVRKEALIRKYNPRFEDLGEKV